MTRHERAVHWVTDRFEGVDAAYRQDVALTTGELCRGAGPCRRGAELLDLFVLALRLRSRARTGDRPEAVWSQGVHMGVLMLLTALATEAAARGGSTGLGVAAALATGVCLALNGRRSMAIALIGAAALAEFLSVANGAVAGSFASCCAVSACGLFARPAEPASNRGPLSVAAVACVPVGFIAASVIGAGTADVVAVAVFFWSAPVVLVLGGWIDPRLAAAATTLVFARLAASGFGELGRALAALQHGGQRELLARWVLMGTGVLAGWFATHRSIRRATQL